MRRGKRIARKAFRSFGNVFLFVGVFMLMFVACCVDSEGKEAWAILFRILAYGTVFTFAGAMLRKLTERKSPRRTYYY